MKCILICLLSIAPLWTFSQGMKIKWEDEKGREFSVNTHSGDFQYSMIEGDELFYNSGSIYDTGPEGTIKKIGSITIEWNTGSIYDTGPKGTIKKVGSITVEWNTGSIYDSGPEGTIKKVGGMTINYNTGSIYDSGPKGTIKNTSGSIKR